MAVLYFGNSMCGVMKCGVEGREPRDEGRTARGVRHLIRPVATFSSERRRNLPDRGGEGDSAVIYTLLGSCRRHGINPFDYLKDLFTRLPATKITEIQQFTP
jgi:IS66 C-terminal element